MNEQNKEMNIKRKDYLLFELNNIKHTLSKTTYNYLLQLINLELSALEESSNILDLVSFKSNPLFAEIVAYNIYTLAYKYLEERTDLSAVDQINNLKLYSDGIRVFEFYYDTSYDNLKNGEIDLYKMVYDPEYNEKLEEDLLIQLDNEYKNASYYHSGNLNEIIQRRERIDKLKKEIMDLRNNIIPNEEEKRKIEISEIYNESLLDFYNISEEGFEPAKDYGDNKKKTYLKKVNEVKIYNNIRYI